MSDWIILRTSGRNTLPLAQSLQHGGFECWTPAAKVQLPRRRVRVAVPILPTFVFAEADQLDDLLALSGAEASVHPGFSVFHYFDKIPIIANCELDPLREIEIEEARKMQTPEKPKKAQPVPVGLEVPGNGVFAGMTGIVEQSDKKWSMVLFGRMSVKIQTFKIHQAVPNAQAA